MRNLDQQLPNGIQTQLPESLAKAQAGWGGIKLGGSRIEQECTWLEPRSPECAVRPCCESTQHAQPVSLISPLSGFPLCPEPHLFRHAFSIFCAGLTILGLHILHSPCQKKATKVQNNQIFCKSDSGTWAVLQAPLGGWGG